MNVSPRLQQHQTNEDQLFNQLDRNEQSNYEQYKVQRLFSIEADIPTNSTICVKKSLEMLPKRSP